MADADLAIASFGATAYELAAMGVPAIHLCLTDDHAISASALANSKASLNLGTYLQTDSKKICTALRELINHSDTRSDIGKVARALIDGQGVSRVAKSLINL